MCRLIAPTLLEPTSRRQLTPAATVRLTEGSPSRTPSPLSRLHLLLGLRLRRPSEHEGAFSSTSVAPGVHTAINWKRCSGTIPISEHFATRTSSLCQFT